MSTTATSTGAGERADLLAALAIHRHFLRVTVGGLTDDQARLRTTVSELCLGGLVKHVADMESMWVDFILGGADAIADRTRAWTAEPAPEDRLAELQMEPGQPLAAVLDRYDEVARRTDEVVATLPDLDVSHPLPPAPWFPPGARWSARRALLHVIAETAQHAGHADIIRESLDGARTMG